MCHRQWRCARTGERIRDKIAASKAKGMWMGGTVPLGYDKATGGARTLEVNETEAALVCRIFALYLDFGSVLALEHRLQSDGIVSKQHVSSTGRVADGQPFCRGTLFHLLRNRLNLGEIRHRDTHHPGLHPAIVDKDLFDAGQRRLDGNARKRKTARETVARSALTGRIFDTDGNAMSSTFAYGKGGRLYRSYVSAPLQQGARRANRSFGGLAATAQGRSGSGRSPARGAPDAVARQTRQTLTRDRA